MGKYENRDKKKELALVTLLTFAMGYFGFIGFPILLLIYPSFAIAIGVKHGIDCNIGIMTVSAFLLSIIYGYVYLPMWFGYIGLAYIINLGIKKNKRISSIVLEGATYTFLVISLLMIILRFYFQVDLLESIKTLLELSLIENLDLLESTEISYDLASIKRSMEELIDTILIAFPSILLMMSLGISAVSYGLSSYIIRKKKIKYIPPFRLADFKLSYSFSVSAVIMLLVTIVMSMIRIGNYEMVNANLTFIIFILLFIQGLGVISFMLVKKKINTILRALIILLLIISSYASIIVSLLGAFDVMFNFRKLKER